MSLARVYETKGPVRKDGLKCGRCGVEIKKGVDRRRTFAVGFRGWEQTRCMKPECYPSLSERESSAVSAVYAAIESVDYDSIESVEDAENVIEEIASACDEVADEYESNEMYEINYDLQERAETVRSAGDELRGWNAEEDEPEEDDERFGQKCEECDGSGTTEGDASNCDACEGKGYTGGDDVYEDVHAEWLDNLRESVRDAIDNMELP